MMPKNTHVKGATSPIDAEGLAPSWPTMAASMYSMKTKLICAKIAGKLSEKMSLIWSCVVNLTPLRISSSKSRFIEGAIVYAW